MWTFEWQYKFGEGVWRRSRQNFDTIQQAADAAAKWMAVCAENDAIVEVRLVEG